MDRNSTISATFKRDFEVALRKESVDRNLRVSVIEYGTGGRSPQGERG